jgi:3-oxoacyl-[acyl-carrier-protein] synthase-3|tara:strand:+ start:186375 stop:187430 length:1056 start_codon:yes stop_codon:yes gene_type:complete
MATAIKAIRFSKVRIPSFGTVFPPEVMSSATIEERLGALYERLKLPLGRLELMTGIRERRFWPDNRAPSAASAEAGEKALKEWGGDRSDIDLVAHCGVCRDRLEPATAAYVHGQLGLANTCQIFDLSNACLGFLNGLTLVSGMIESGQIRRALLVSGENGRPLLEYTIKTLLGGHFTRKTIKPYFANLTIGAGAVACVITHADDAPEGAMKFLGGVVETDSSANKLCQGGQVDGHGLEMLTEAEALLDAGLAVAERNWDRFKAAFGWAETKLDRFICHQVGRSHQRQLVERLGLDPAKDFTTYEHLGNVGSVSLPITLAEAVRAGAVKTGDKIALLGIGSGLSSMMMGVEA